MGSAGLTGAQAQATVMSNVMPLGVESQMRPLRQRLASFRNQIFNLSGVGVHGFFIDYAYAGSLEPVVSPYVEVEALLAREAQGQLDLIDEMASYAEHLQHDDSIDWDIGTFPQLDQLAAYALVRRAKPKRILEIGSGSSTLILKRALDDEGHGGVLTCIDPKPRRSIEATGATLERRLLRPGDVEIVRGFEANDVLFIDSSHIMLPGMDVDIQFNRMFPVLKPGVLVHVHDIFLPDDYPLNWHGRWYSEQNALVGWIVSGYFDVVYAGYYVRTRMNAELRRALSGVSGINQEFRAGSIWLRRSASTR